MSPVDLPPLIPLVDSWSYEKSDFDDGYILWDPHGQYLMTEHGIPTLFPTVRSMLRYIEQDKKWEQKKREEKITWG